MAPRKGHKKSRNGCTNCKRRRIKCDETHPQCFNCERHATRSTCVYLPVDIDIELLESPDDSSILSRTSTSGTSPNLPLKLLHCFWCRHNHPSLATRFPSKDFPGAIPPCVMTSKTPISGVPPSESGSFTSSNFSVSLSVTDLSLLYQFTESTAHITFSYLPEIQNLWAHVVPGPEIGQKWNFVLHGIMALSASHSGHKARDEHRRLNCSQAIDSDSINSKVETYTSIAEQHFRAAFSQVKEVLVGQDQGLKQDNCHAVFATLNLFTMHLLSLRPSPMSSTCHQQHTGLNTSWVTFSQCTFGIIQETLSWLSRGPVSQIFMPQTPYPGKPWHECNNDGGLTRRTEQMLKELHALAGDWTLNLFEKRPEVVNAEEMDELGDAETATAYFMAVWNLRRVWTMVEKCIRNPLVCSDYLTDLDEADKQMRQKKIGRPDAIIAYMFQFTLHTPRRFWECLEKKRPRALIIFAYFCACWEVFSFGSVSSYVQRDKVEDDNDDNGTTKVGNAVIWWTSGRAEMDLTAIEEEFLKSEIGIDNLGSLEARQRSLSNIGNASAGRNLEGKKTWREWIVGAWQVVYGLREGWWLDDETELAANDGMVHNGALVKSGQDNPTQDTVTLEELDTFFSLYHPLLASMPTSTPELVSMQHFAPLTSTESLAPSYYYPDMNIPLWMLQGQVEAGNSGEVESSVVPTSGHDSMMQASSFPAYVANSTLPTMPTTEFHMTQDVATRNHTYHSFDQSVRPFDDLNPNMLLSTTGTALGQQ